MSCVVCNVKDHTMKRCVRCKSVLYCSKKCQIQDWPVHRALCNTTNFPLSIGDTDLNKSWKNRETLNSNNLRKIFIKFKQNKFTLVIPNCSDDPKLAFELICKKLHIPMDKLKLITKGKVVNEDNVIDFIFNKNLTSYMAVGEESEDETGLNQVDIDTIVRQLNVNRNKAIRGLRHCDGNLIDAILFIGDTL